MIRNENLYTHRLYFGEHNVAGMFTVLEPLHLKMEKGPETLKEISFNHVSSFVSSYPSHPSSPSISSCFHPSSNIIPLLPSSPSSSSPSSSSPSLLSLIPLHPPLPGIWPRLGGGIRLV